MNARIFTTTTDARGMDVSSIIKEAKTIAGKHAGMCYSNGNFDKIADDDESALNRYNDVAPTGHHSITGPARISVELTGISKILAMTLNNLQYYDTLEKSGRYTTMEGSTELENTKYTKWLQIIKHAILKYSAEHDMDVDEKYATKLAKENARYFLSIFSPMVNMTYTTSLAQWTYIIQWMEDLSAEYDYIAGISGDKLNIKYDFFRKFSKEMKDLTSQLRDLGLFNEELKDTKGRRICRFDEKFDDESYVSCKSGLYIVNKDPCPNVHCRDGVLTARLVGSFAQFAQLQRHRTATFEFSMDNGSSTLAPYVPPIVEWAMSRDEWILDMLAIQNDGGLIPIGSTIAAKMIVTYENFRLMLSERMCGRAQLETMRTVQKVFNEAVFFFEDFRKFAIRRGMIKSICDNFSKCKTTPGYVCKEPCVFIKNGLKNRIF